MNIFGEGLPEQIIKQVNVRQKTYGSGYADGFPRTPEQIVVLNANTGWIKLLSSVDIPDTTKINNPTIMGLGLSGNELAKRYILFNGTSRKNGSKTNMAEGITTTNDDRGEIEDQSSLATYGIGGTEFGLNPMMGITSISVNHENRGSLRRAVVKIKAYNKIQFEIIDVLYLRLGFQVLLEWGNSLYLDNTGTYEPLITNNFSLADDFLRGSGNVKNDPPPGEQFKYFHYDDFLQRIHQNRLDSCGNYDAMFAKVTNFHWSVNKDGSYDIEVNLASIGDIIESLKVNISTKKKIETIKSTAEDSSELSDKEDIFFLQNFETTAIGEFFFTFAFPNVVLDVSEFENNVYSSLAQNVRPNALDDDDLGTNDQMKLIKIYFQNDQGYNTADYFVSIAEIKNIPDLNYKPNLNLTGFTNKYERDFLGIIFDNYLDVKKFAFGIGGRGSGSRMYFVRLGTFLQFLQDCIMIQQNTKNNPSFKPSLKFDYDAETNIVNTINHQVSLDPRICVVSKKVNLEFEKSDNGSNYAIFNPCGSDVTALMDKTINFPQSDEKEGDFISDKLKHLGEYGRIMNTFVNCRFILDKMESIKDENGDVVLIDFLQGILDGVSEGLGGINNLDVFIDETLNTVKIIDKNPLKNKDAVLKYIHDNKPLFPYAHKDPSQEISTDPTVFQLFGYNDSSAGFVKDFTFKTELTPAFSTMITVGAAANSSVVGEENTALSRINKGLTDRYKEIVINVVDPVEEKKKLDDKTREKAELIELLEIRIREYEIFILSMSQSEVNQTFSYGAECNAEDISLYINLLKEIEELQVKFLKINEKPYMPTSHGKAFIPFNLALIMDGLSGMKINEKFTVNTDFLPSNYPDNVEFLIKNLTHEVANNKWTTKVDSYCIAKQPTDYVYVPSTFSPIFPTRSAPTPPPIPSGGGVGTSNVGDYSKTLTSGFFMEREIVSGMTNNGKWKVAGEPTIFTKSQIYLHHTAGWATMDQGKGTVTGWNSKAKYLRETIDPATGISILGTQNKTTGDWFVPSGAPYVIDGFGHVEQLADDRFFYITQGSRYFSNANQIGIGIEVCNPGYVEKISGKWTALSTDLQKYPSYLSGWLDKSKKFDVGNGISELVDENGIPTKYRTKEYGISYHPEQVKNLEALIRRLMSKYSIPFKWEGKKTYDQMFPKAATALLDANNGVPGVYTHAIGGRKVDMMPNSEIITMLKKFT